MKYDETGGARDANMRHMIYTQKSNQKTRMEESNWKT